MVFNFKKIYAGAFFIIFSMVLGILAPTYAENKAEAPAAVEAPVVQTVFVKPLQLVQNPSKFLDKSIKMNATFDKFSTLGLDYKRALRDSQSYIGFLIQRDDVVDHDIPLSELKLFLKRQYAEKFIDLDTGDRIEISGKVFSNALGDAWVDVDNLVVLKKAKADKKAQTAEKTK